MAGPVFPIELEREIFETTALMHRKTIPALLRVAHRVLLEPLLYRVLIIGSDDGVSNAVRRAMQTKPAGFFHKSVRHVAITTLRSQEDSYALLRLCTGLVSFSTLGYSFQPAILPILQKMTQMRKWSGHLNQLFGTPAAIDFTHPFFRAITHLDIFDTVTGNDMEAYVSLAAMSALTHLCLNGQVGEAFSWRVLDECAHLQVLVNMWEEEIDTHLARAIAANPPVSDKRFVVCLYYENYLKDWEVGARGAPIFGRRRTTLLSESAGGKSRRPVIGWTRPYTSANNRLQAVYY
ncbi:hypothetical protein B0H17DRAFT_1326265 [Mycena rosella]|uniref:Uncharacterized protein n=1 Tax=Mycena rosella TaxID=1033263 RepID=A0AAD7M8C6_MYCRO|nr:hypothetical protein B0H17DRAFT_1326265 [Mycena rosella]